MKLWSDQLHSLARSISRIERLHTLTWLIWLVRRINHPSPLQSTFVINECYMLNKKKEILDSVSQSVNAFFRDAKSGWGYHNYWIPRRERKESSSFSCIFVRGHNRDSRTPSDSIAKSARHRFSQHSSIYFRRILFESTSAENLQYSVDSVYLIRTKSVGHWLDPQIGVTGLVTLASIFSTISYSLVSLHE